MESAINNGMCRCCASEGTFKDLKSAYQWMGDEEVYSEMLRECFDITLFTNIEGEVEGGICEVCVTQLRNASNFKKQVLQTEEQFKLRLQDKLFKNDIVKVEAQPDSDNDSDNDHASEDYSEYEVPIKLESDEPKPKKRGAKASTSRAKRTKTDDGETSKRNVRETAKMIKIEPHVRRTIPIKPLSAGDLLKLKGTLKIEKKDNTSEKKLYSVNTVGSTTIRKTVGSTTIRKIQTSQKLRFAEGAKYVPPRTSNPIKTLPRLKKTLYVEDIGRLARKQLLDVKKNYIPIKVPPKTTEKTEANSAEKNKHLHNLKTVLDFSNITPLSVLPGDEYECCFCNSKYVDPAYLKGHILENHRQIYNTFMHNVPLKEYVVKVDTTGLECRICSEKMEELELFMTHLQSHGKQIHTDIKNLIIPFKFVDRMIHCVYCSQTFVHFKVIMNHVREHFRYFTCEDCNVSFITAKQYKGHINRHADGEYKCTICSRTFTSRVKKVNHEYNVHKRQNKRSKCTYCDEKFCSYGQKVTHMMKVHDFKPVEQKCQACDKSFLKRKDLVHHTKKFHLMDRPHECDVCENKYFSKSELNKHMLSHTGVREYQCAVCLKSYVRKATLREHMRIHENDRRFKCEACGQAFIQKCSWKSHMKSRHGEIMLEDKAYTCN
ncbi:zinc finger protein 93-like isoform X1 [Pectinophora gossypiella]|uniref:zinc finger protein 93-like isoform X1 n=1 Tax=Pectinophora gossypiella TaxID=13191 RepID=UPI00214E54CC|nr:zinc finger protein 93-like isoform X1 [Pectinophora gossypiella]